jgi:hypothetical protein
MEPRLLVDLDVLEILQRQKPSIRKRLTKRFREIQSFPGHYSDYPEKDHEGRRVEVSICAGWAIHYWADMNDRHIKILALRSAGR